MFAIGANWKSWMQDFRFGTLAFVPTGDIRTSVDELRQKFDPISAQTSMAHVTLTQPLTQAPSSEDIQNIARIIQSFEQFQIQVGPATTSPNKRLLWLDIAPKEKILELREALHATGLFRTDLPLTKGFIPHMTISESGREPGEVQTINQDLNSLIKPWNTEFNSVAWIIPDENFTFLEYRKFDLK